MVVDQVIHGMYRAQAPRLARAVPLYIDEVGDFATPDIPYVIDKKSKAGLRLTVAHQRFGHIKDENVMSVGAEHRQQGHVLRPHAKTTAGK